jgi:hypothetical protein
MNESARFLPLPVPNRARRAVLFLLLSALALSLGACGSTVGSRAGRMVSKYSLKKRKTDISCNRPEGLAACRIPVRVTAAEYRRMLGWIEAARGTKYSYGGTVPDGFDCSGFVQYLYSLSFGLALPRTSGELALVGPIVGRPELRRGDLLFFSSGGEVVDHVGVFLGEGRFAHASSKAGVTVSSLSQLWYDRSFAFGTRVVTVE